VLVEFAREKQFKAVVARTARAAITLVNQVKPSAIALDLVLPDKDGWVVHDRPEARSHDTPHPCSYYFCARGSKRSLTLGAVSHLEKPVTKEALENAPESDHRIHPSPDQESVGGGR
jgi:DNA-binding response OmpR family regulator